ncbi:hypothetical protein MCEMAEM6B_02446 [Mycobacteriaceae bacterium]
MTIDPSTVVPAAGGPTRPTRRGRRGAVLAAVFTATAALTAGTTYALARTPATGPSPVGLSADQTQAREHLCAVFVTATKNAKGKGGVMADGTLNVPVMLRVLNRAVALQDALSPAVPADLADATRTYITGTLDLTTAATAGEPVPVLEKLNTVSNGNRKVVSELCGLR